MICSFLFAALLFLICSVPFFYLQRFPFLFAALLFCLQRFFFVCSVSFLVCSVSFLFAAFLFCLQRFFFVCSVSFFFAACPLWATVCDRLRKQLLLRSDDYFCEHFLTMEHLWANCSCANYSQYLSPFSLRSLVHRLHLNVLEIALYQFNHFIDKLHNGRGRMLNLSFRSCHTK